MADDAKTLGDTLREERERRQQTVRQAAEGTRIKPTHIEALERADFSRIASPIYAKGFIKLYAEWLEIDPAPLLREYLERHAPRERPPLATEPAPRPDAPGALRTLRARWKALQADRAPAAEPPAGRPPSAPAGRPAPPRERLPGHRLRAAVALVLAILLVAGFLLLRRRPAAGERPAPSRAPVATTLLEPPPEPYLAADDAPPAPPGSP